ncbi:MAG: hypothetical protein AB1445_01170 [Bacillota bacterium]
MRTRVWRPALGRKQPLPSADTLARTLERLDAGELWTYNQKVIQQARHNKVWSGRSIGGLMVIAVDGTELYKTKAPQRACKNCSTRTLKNGKVQYYERVVAVSLVGRAPRVLYTIEPQRPGRMNRRRPIEP